MQRQKMICWFVSAMIVTASMTVAQTQLEQSIQVVRDWLGDPNALVVYVGKHDSSVDFLGPRNEYVFETSGYRVAVDLKTMKVTNWFLYAYEWVDKARTDLPMLGEEQVKNIATNYIQQHFPYYNEFSNWQITVYKYQVTNLNETKSAYLYNVDFTPYIINKNGQRILVLTTSCGVNIDPYQGTVLGFGYFHMPITLTNLIPSFSEQEAKTKVEQEFLRLGAAQANAVMSSPDLSDLPDGLIIGATQTSGLRLLYAFDYVEAIGAPGYEDIFGDAENPTKWRVGVDAHTGEVFVVDEYMGLKELLLKNSIKVTFQKKYFIGIVIIVAICLSLLIIKIFRKTKIR